VKAQAAAVAAQYGIPLPQSPPGSVGEAIRNETAIDPAWTAGATWTIPVSTNANAAQNTNTLGSGSTPLDM
jgi:hypothetical protein